jgi:hypothetical protein
VSTPEAKQAFAHFVDLISTATGRNTFLANPRKALEDQGANVDALPAELLETLLELDARELRLVVRLNAAVVGAGMGSDDQASLGYL